METIFHEKQEGQLCAQHCLNNLLQEAHYTAVDLAKIADQLDQEEAATLAEGVLNPSDLLSFSDRPSANMDDSGYFSVQVITRALSVWNLTMALWNSPDMKAVMENPTSQKAFICNHDNHWLTIRKLGRQWFNINSLLGKPELISDTYLSLFLTQLQLEGYSIFVIVGNLPPCEADDLLTLIPIEPEKKTPARTKQKPTSGQSSSSGSHSGAADKYDRDLAAAMSASMVGQEDGKDRDTCKMRPTKETRRPDILEEMEDFDIDLATALSMSMQDHIVQASEQQVKADTSSVPIPQTSTSQQAHGVSDSTPCSQHTETNTAPGPQGSMEQGNREESDASLSVEEMRLKRLKHLGESGDGKTA